MTLYQAELKYYLRSPIIWLVLALTALISAWSFLLSIELFTVMQVKFAGMSDAPTIIQGIIFPLVLAQSKILIIVIAIIAGLSFSRLSQNNLWSLISVTQLSDWQIIKHKYLANLIVVLVFVFPSFMTITALIFMTEIAWIPIVFVIAGLLLLLLWMLALGMLISCLVNNSGFAILLCIVMFMFLWLLSQSGINTEWGKNWIQVFSPFYHFKQFFSDYIPLSSVFYFIVGSVLSLWAIKTRLIQKRYFL